MDEREGTTRRHFLELAALAGAGVIVVGGTEAGATPPTGTVTRKPLAQGRLDDQITLSTQGPSDFHIQRVTVAPGADSGWHTHPGVALDILTAGTLSVYVEGTKCEPRRFEAGQAFFVPPGVTHMARNEGADPAEVYITYLVAAGAVPRADAAKPANCS